MSEQILKALMQLFAIISRPESDILERRRVVEDFLRKQLNLELAQAYLWIFEEYYNEYQEKYKNKAKYQKYTSSSSVRLLVICAQINKELTQNQKVALMLLLLSFIKSGHAADSAISEFEQEFVETVAQAFNVTSEDFKDLFNFVLLPIEAIPDSSHWLLINNKEHTGTKRRHLFRDGIRDSIIVLHLQSVNMYICRYEGLKELYLNSQAMDSDRVYTLNYGCSIRNSQVKPIYYSDVVNCFYHGTQDNPLLFVINNITYQFEDGKVGLHPIDLEVRSGNLVAIMGGSGAGKSTLLGVLTGSYKPTSGQVSLNHIDIHTQKQAVEGLIGSVSQDDLLIEELTVFQNLFFNGKLCFGQYSDEEIHHKTEETLKDVGLYDIRDMKVGSPLNKKISGGQRKRLNIALELIRQPAVLFLDEPTSGLSSRDSDNIMVLLKELSLKGKLVFVVIHQPSSDIFKMFDRMLILDQGGYLIYNGNPIDSILYFKSQTQQADRFVSECSECGNVNPEQIFNIVESRVLDEQGQATGMRRISPKEWYMAFEKIPKIHTPESEQSDAILAGTIKRPSRFKQFMVYATRNVLTKISDFQYIAICLLEAPLLALLLAYIIRYYNLADGRYTFEQNENLPIYIFVAVIVAIFIGLSVSAEEIIKDRKILKREAFLNLSWGSYLFSKALVLFAISAIQAALFVWVGNSITGILHMSFAYWVVLFSAWACANLMGLIISDSFKSVVTIYILIPFIVIPQLMLSGVLLRFEKINPNISIPASIPWYGELITARWAYEAIAVEQFTNNEYEKVIYPYEKNMSIAEFRKNYWVVEMKNKLQEVSDDLEKGYNPNKATLTLLCNEIERENQRQELIRSSFCEQVREGISAQLVDETTLYLDQLTRYYTMLYNKTAEHKDRKTADMNADSLLWLKSNFYNQNLADMVKNTNETYRLIEYKERLQQNYHSIYNDPEHKFLKAQFYAPVKQIFGHYYPTLWVNVAIIWCFNILFFIALYFRWLPNLFKLLGKFAKIKI